MTTTQVRGLDRQLLARARAAHPGLTNGVLLNEALARWLADEVPSRDVELIPATSRDLSSIRAVDYAVNVADIVIEGRL